MRNPTTQAASEPRLNPPGTPPRVLPPELLTVTSVPCPDGTGRPHPAGQYRAMATANPPGVVDPWDEEETAPDPRTAIALIAIYLQCREEAFTYPRLLAEAERQGPSVVKELKRMFARAKNNRALFAYEVAALVASHAPTGLEVPRLRKLSEATQSEVRWLWPAWIPRGALSIVQGDPGAGKTLLALDVAAHLSRGDPMPVAGAHPLPALPEATLVIATEDTLGSATRRLSALGAGLERVLFLDPMEEGRPFRLPSAIALLESWIAERRVGLVIIDPVADILDAGLHLGDGAGVRTALLPLRKMAAATGVAIILVRHLTKGARGSRDRGVGSHALKAVVSAELQVDACDDDQDRRTVTCLKTIGSKPAPIDFGVVTNPQGETCIEWLGTAEAGHARQPPGPPPLAREVAEEFLLVQLAHGPRRVVELKALADARNIAEKTLRSAREKLAVQTTRAGNVVSWELLPGLLPRARAVSDRSMVLHGM